MKQELDSTSRRKGYLPGLALCCASAAALVAAACDSGGTSTGIDTGQPAPVEAGTAGGSTRSLTLSLDHTLDMDDDDPKATLITSATLLDVTGHLTTSAAIVAGSAVFALDGVAAGDYFVAVNGDADDLVPTRLSGNGESVTQRVGQTLRASYIGPANHPTYRVNTWSSGQKKTGIVKYSDGTGAGGGQPYVLMTFDPPRVEFLVLGSGAPITAFTPAPVHATAEPFDSWILNTPGKDHHGDSFAADGGASACSGCHWEDWRKPLGGYAEVRPSNSWCFACHNGTDGSGSGFVDPRN